ncbi:MAG: FtsK/SpoIIIE domain-containing protein [Porcipelethomonas sp.]
MVLMVYTKKSVKEYLLPNSQNIDYILDMDNDIFMLGSEMSVKLENIDGKWFINEDDIYKINAGFNGKVLKDGDLLELKCPSGEIINIIVIDKELSYCIPVKYDTSGVSSISVGMNENSDICYSFNDYVSKNHCILKRSGGMWTVEDLSTNGVFVNNKRINKQVRLKFGDSVNIFGINIVFLDNIIGVSSRYGKLKVSRIKVYEKNQINAVSYEDSTNTVYYNRSPRNIPVIYNEEIAIEEPPAKKVVKHPPLIQQIGPSFTMAIPMLLGCGLAVYGSYSSGMGSSTFMYTGIITAVGSALLGSMWGIFNIRYAKQQEYEEERMRFDAYGNYIMGISDKLRDMYMQNTSALNEMYPPASVYCGYNRNSLLLWNRNFTHDDCFFHRLGIGDIEFQVKIRLPNEKFSLVFDKLKEKPKYLNEEFRTLKNVPVGIDIAEKRLWGITSGPGKTGSYEVMYNLAASIAANNCYTDVKMVFIYDSESPSADKWDFARWLPHVWSENRSFRYTGGNYNDRTDIFNELSKVFRERMEGENSIRGGSVPKPYYVMFIEDYSLIESEIISKYVFSKDERIGLATFIFSDSCENLPNSCEDIISNDMNFKGVFNVLDSSSKKQEISFDLVSADMLRDFACNISGLQVRELENDTDIPSVLSFFEMYGVEKLEELNVLERWKKNRTYNTMKALIGKKAGGADCYLDIHEKFHGPHGLIAGTTGSGKSETLQTYILSLAVNYSPEDIGFFIIDFKGGGMANCFSDLPHLVGQISNLSGNQVYRAMVSIKSENMRRQRIFNEYGVNSINQYTRLYKNNEAKIPVPHLFIIIDEFAELKREQPEFMRELISVAQVGRSLGVHLILATQKPSGTVDDNIWSNSKFKLCLRVQDRQDSNDMLHKPDAAYITQAGRCYMQVGNDEIYELFQSGWSGAVYDRSMSENKNNIATMITLTGKTAVVGSKARKKRKEKEKLDNLEFLVNTVKNLTRKFELKTGSLAADRSAANSIAESILEYSAEKGFDFGNSQADIENMIRFLNVFPFETESIDEVCRIIINSEVKIPDVKEKTQLDAVVEYLCETAEKNNYGKVMQLWLPVLEKQIYLKELAGYELQSFENGSYEREYSKWSIDVIAGMYDDPVNQSQLPLTVNFSKNGHLAVCGMVVSGKSTFLQTLMYSLADKYSPDYVNMYFLDFSSQVLETLSGLPHCGGILGKNDIDKVGKFFNMISKMLDERSKLFGGGNYSQYVEANGVILPAVFVVIDNFADFREKTEDKYEDVIMRISRDGIGCGIFLVITAAGFGMTEIPNRVADNIKSVICLEMGDKYKYMEVLRTNSINVLPESDIKGRGLACIGDGVLEFQTALAEEGSDDYARGNNIKAKCRLIRDSWKGKYARPVPVIPENPDIYDISSVPGYVDAVNTASLIPFAYNVEDASVCSIDLSKIYCFSVSGKSNTGKKNVLKMIMAAASEKGGKIIVIENSGAKLRKFADKYAELYLDSPESVFSFLNDITPEFVRRNKKKNSMLAEGFSNEEIYEKMSDELPYYIFISDLNSFIDMIYQKNEKLSNMNGFMENIFEKGSIHNIYFFAGVNTEKAFSVMSRPAYMSFVNYKKGVHLGGNISGQRIFAFNNIPYADQNRPMPRGTGYMADENDESCAKNIIIPFAGRKSD